MEGIVAWGVWGKRVIVHYVQESLIQGTCNGMVEKLLGMGMGREGNNGYDLGTQQDIH